jgi:TPR repeat protein
MTDVTKGGALARRRRDSKGFSPAAVLAVATVGALAPPLLAAQGTKPIAPRSIGAAKFKPEFGVMLRATTLPPGAVGLVSAKGFLFGRFTLPIGDLAKAPARLLRRRASAGSISAMVSLGALMYGRSIAARLSGRGSRDGFRVAHHWWSMAAARGSAAADVMLGLSRLEGLAARRSYWMAASHFRKAAARGDRAAMAMLAYTRFMMGGAKWTARGNYWLNRAIAAGSREAIVLDGVGYLLAGEGRPDPARAAAIFRIASRAGSAVGAFDLGLCYLRGIGVVRNRQHARVLVRSAARKGVTAAMCTLGYILQNGVGGQRSPRRAVHWFKLAAKLGDPSAVNDLGSLYYHGVGVPRSLKKSFNLFRLAARAGDTVAMVNLADAYSWGYGTPRNEHKFHEWLKRAAKAGQPTAMWQLALVYLSGPDAAKTATKGVQLIRRAAGLGQPQALRALGSLYFYGQGGLPRNLAQSRHYYELAAARGSVRAALNLGFMYLRGQGVPAGPRRALHWFRRAEGLLKAMGQANAPGVVQRKAALEAGLREAEAALGKGGM